MNDVILALDPIANELDHILDQSSFDRQQFVADLERYLRAHKALFSSEEVLEEELVVNCLRAAFEVLQAATKIVHLGFNRPVEGTKTVKRGRLLRNVEELREMYDLAEQATRRPDVKTRFYDDHAARDALTGLFDKKLDDGTAQAGRGRSYQVRGGVLETFLGSDAQWTRDDLKYHRADALKVAEFVRGTWLG